MDDEQIFRAAQAIFDATPPSRYPSFSPRAGQPIRIPLEECREDTKQHFLKLARLTLERGQ